jgi:hypothetical protein
MKTLIAVLFSAACLTQAQAAIIQFDLLGRAGAGLLGGNEFPTAVTGGGSGGELPGGIFYDDISNLLTLNVGWGSANGFINLTGNTTAGHLHGLTTSGGVASFTQTASPKYFLDSLPGWNTSASAGGYSGTISILAADEAALLNGQFYFNVHTAVNGGGEIRGNLVPVPEPSTIALGVGIGALLLGLRFRRQS